MVLPLVGIVAGVGVSAQPKLTMVPDTVSPCSGVSIVPNGFGEDALAAVIRR
jgi:hypothetical protein